MLNQSYRGGFIDKTEKALFDNIFEFADRIVREIMVPRVEMVTIDIYDSYDDILKKIEQEQHT